MILFMTAVLRVLEGYSLETFYIGTNIINFLLICVAGFLLNELAPTKYLSWKTL